MLISEKMQNALNEQINKEQYSSHLYLAMAAACDSMTLKGFAQFYYAQAQEESGHAMKMLKYVIDAGGKVELKAVDAPRAKYASAAETAQLQLEHELKVTSMINDLVALAEKEKDYATRSFLAWFVDEQVEEVSTAQTLVDLIEMTPKNMIIALDGRVMQLRGG